MRQLGLLGIACRHRRGRRARRSPPGRPARYAAVLADIHMPRMDGHELTRRHPRRRGRHGRRPHAGRRRHRQRDARARRSAASPPAWTPICQAGEHRPAAHHAGALAADPRRPGQRPLRRRDRRRAPRSTAACSPPGSATTRPAINSLFSRFRETAIESERDDRGGRAQRQPRQAGGGGAQAQRRRPGGRRQCGRHRRRGAGAGRQGRRPGALPRRPRPARGRAAPRAGGAARAPEGLIGWPSDQPVPAKACPDLIRGVCWFAHKDMQSFGGTNM